MDIFEKIEISDCPLCFGAGILEEEGNGFYAMCLDCGCQTASVSYKSEEDREDAARRAAYLWDAGKVIKMLQGE